MILSFLDYFKYEFVIYALIAAILISVCASILGVILVLKRYSYMGDGLSHIAFGAFAVAAVANISNNLLIILPITILSAIIILKLGNNKKIKGDAIIAITSVSCLAFGYLIMSVFPKSSNISGDVCESLFGSTQILSLTLTDLILIITLTIVVIAFFIIFYHKIFAITFDETFAKATGVKTEIYNLFISILIAIVITLAMRLVGSLLISALIIFPALSAMRYVKSFKKVIILSVIISLITTFLGFILSLQLDTPIGPTIVIVDVIFFIISLIIRKIKK